MVNREVRQYTLAMDGSDWKTIAVWFAGIVVGFKLWTVLLVFVFVLDWPTAWFMLLNHVAWFVVPLVLISGPIVFWSRLVRMRWQREQLLRSEWEINEPTHRRP